MKHLLCGCSRLYTHSITKIFKQLLLLASALFIAQSLHAQRPLTQSRLRDNWFTTLSTGCLVSPVHQAVWQHLSPQVQLGIGRYLIPSYGMGALCEAAFDEESYAPKSPYAVKQIRLYWIHYVNLNNFVMSYSGRPDIFELTATFGLGWGCRFLSEASGCDSKHFPTSRLSLQMGYNIGKSRAWQIFAEPVVEFCHSRINGQFEPKIHARYAQVGLNIGVHYRLKNTNGTHHFTYARIYDQVEVDALNAKINDLREELKKIQEENKP